MFILEAFESIQPLKKCSFYIYGLYGYNQEPLSHVQIHAISEQLRSYLAHTPIQILFISKGKVWLSAPLVDCPPIPGFRLIPEGWYEADFETDHIIYEHYIEQAILQSVAASPFTMIDAHTLQTSWIQEKQGELKNKQGILYVRQFHFYAKVNAQGKVLLLLSFNGLLKSEKNIYEWLCQGEQVEGLLVQYDWVKIGGIGKINKVLTTTISQVDQLAYMGQSISLLEYYRQKGQAYFINHFTAEDEAACVIEATFKEKSYQFIPHALTPIITREALAQIDPIFSKQLVPYMKQNMARRFLILQHCIKTLQSSKWQLPFIFDTTKFSNQLIAFGWQSGYFNMPLLKGKVPCQNHARHPLNEKKRIFKEGFYKESTHDLSLVIFYPKAHYKSVFDFARILEKFTRAGIWQEKRDHQLAPCLLTKLLPLSSWQFCAYDPLSFSTMHQVMAEKYQSASFALVITPDETENLYEHFKCLGASYQTPSQMLKLQTMQQVITGDVAGYAAIKNIVLGILVKNGGIPWLAEQMPSQPSCFIGFDVAMQESGKHYAACSLVFNEAGEVLAYYKPKEFQSGEKMTAEVLAELFDKVFRKYSAQYGHLPQHVVIHRDGFANEQLDWYIAYFKHLGITFDLVEIRKNCRMKMADEGTLGYHNPPKGAYLIQDQKGYLVTTQIEDRRGMGSPAPLLIEKIYGPTDFKVLLEQVFILSEIHVGAFQDTRLPITTAYADSMCKAIDYIPEGKVDNKLYFL